MAPLNIAVQPTDAEESGESGAGAHHPVPDGRAPGVGRTRLLGGSAGARGLSAKSWLIIYVIYQMTLSTNRTGFTSLCFRHSVA